MSGVNIKNNLIGITSNATYAGAGTSYIIQTNNNVIYIIYIDILSDIAYTKSIDNGLTWSDPTTISGAITATQLSVWYDRWSGLNSDLIHVVWTESALDDVTYININAGNNDNLSSATIVFAGASTANGGALSITRARGGNIGVAYMIDAGAERGFAKSTDTGATWVLSADPTEATTDQWILLPGWAADNQDLMMFFWDASANEISRKLYDDSANTWSETLIATGMVDLIATTAFPNFAATVDITNSQNLLVAWSAIDTLNADLRCWTVTESAITEKTNVVLDSVDDQGLCVISIDTNTNYWYVYYAGKSDGTETWTGNMNIYKKISTDSGVTWGNEQLVTPNIIVDPRWLCSIPRFNKNNLITLVSLAVTSYLGAIAAYSTYNGRILIT